MGNLAAPSVCRIGTFIWATIMTEKTAIAERIRVVAMDLNA